MGNFYEADIKELILNKKHIFVTDLIVLLYYI